jgi:hypothetical protein
LTSFVHAFAPLVLRGNARSPQSDLRLGDRPRKL